MIDREKLCWIIFDSLIIQTKFNRFLTFVPGMFWPKKISKQRIQRIMVLQMNLPVFVYLKNWIIEHIF